MIYRNSRCPYCDFYIEQNVTYKEPIFMPSLLPCPKCGNLYQTKKKLWSEMSQKEQMEISKKYCGKLSYIYSFLDIWIFNTLIILFSLAILIDKKNFIEIILILFFCILIILLATILHQKSRLEEFNKAKKITFEDYINKKF